VVRQPIALRVAREHLILPVEPVQAQSRGQPQRSLAVLVNGSDATALQLAGGVAIDRVVHKGVRLVVEAAQNAAPGADPERAGTISMDSRDAIRQAGRFIWTGPVVGKPIRCWVEAADAAKLSHP